MLDKLKRFFSKKTSDNKLLAVSSKDMSQLARQLSHDLCTPFAALKLNISNMHEIISEITNTQKYIQTNNHRSVTQTTISTLDEFYQSINHELNFIEQYLKLFTFNLGNCFLDDNSEHDSILALTKHAIASYPYKSPYQKQQLNWHYKVQQNISIANNKMYFSLILYNFIRFALNHTKLSRDISVSAHQNHRYIQIDVKLHDLITNIESTRGLFDFLYRSNQDTIDFGLYFSRSALLAINGKFYCYQDSTDTLFTLLWPL